MKKWGFILLVILIGGIMGYNYIYQDHRDIETEKPEYVLTSKTLIDEFSSNVKASEQKYLNKTIELSGNITEIGEHNLVLNSSIFCQFQNPVPNSIKTGQDIIIKGRFIGYDDLLEEIKLDQSTIINH
ncbi:hypothetical protein H7U19_04630 [Hyunsoonleella sp. SJ7]|uniref:tRNA_anti-like n=1 Tax=Hyunsoonleella aquatilis TaxID=2762758 RepID=A0A923HAY1_9FLAO|nr:hypothetical protein [Hyunsoonleella aquatilis]MBC3757676.1 hypothetical protein [Hyunsoonleella aquatilis]